MTSVAERGVSNGAFSRRALDAAPIVVLEQDFSAVANFCEERRAAGVTDIGAFLSQEPGRLSDLLASVIVRGANQAAVSDFGVGSGEQLVGALAPDRLFYNSPNSFVEQVVAVFEGRCQLRVESEGIDNDGNPVWHTLNWSAGSNADDIDYSRVLVIVEDTTSQRSAQMHQVAHEEQLQALIEIGGQLTAMLEPSVIITKVLQTIDDALHPTRVALTLLDLEKCCILENAAITSDSDGYAPTFDQLTSGLSGTAMRAGVALIADDVSMEAGFAEPAKTVAADMVGWSEIAAPIVSSGAPIGVIDMVFSPDRMKPTPEAASLIATLAGQVAVAIRNAEMYAELSAGHAALQTAHKELQDTQTQLLAAQKMEAIGSLAAGIAHEINTPIQYVGDNVRFLSDSAAAATGVLATARSIMDELESRGDDELVAKYRDAVVAADLDFIAEEVPDAIEQTMEGVGRVAEIVRAMKEFAHPGRDEKAPIDVNRSIETTVAVASNEWKYVADIDMQLDKDLPLVPALNGPLNQSLLILIVNAAQALEGVVDKTSGEKGTITISTCVEANDAVIRVADNGPGIPADIADQIFDPFFTTKDVGKGSGQGLSIAHTVVVDRHGGAISVESESGSGATFVVRIPLAS